ncbi:translin-associated factor X-interacting protein 1 isoform X1 [Electrophorus electricus]|uniref:translin-associated factor X-interacting protein 1 isoform X1 n=1 Tax=Electrophorus electricus TaxID=8005 RepID=UPI0015D05EBD|nr:translin-associated factor X-interacting protein 1 isoform X1 [Electrophorus electricus]
MSTEEDIRLPPISMSERTSLEKGFRRPRSKIFTAKIESTLNSFSTWPAHVSSQTVKPRGQKHAGAEVNTHHGCGYEFGGSVAKPRFLEQLECYLKGELTSLDMLSPKLQEEKLQAYREVFDYFIEAFKTYKPLLSAIKREYDTTLSYLQEQIRELEPLRAQLVLLSEQCEQRILGLRELERAEIRAVKQEQQHLLQVIESMKEQQRGLQTQVCHLKEELAAQYLLYREERDARKLLIASISNMSYSTDEEPEEEQDGEKVLKDDDPVKEKLALKVCREDLSRAQVELNRLHAEYGDVVPRRDWENLDCMYQENLLKLQTLQSDFDQMKSEYDTLLGVHREVSMQRDSLQSELEVFQEASTPRPHWEQCADVIGSRERCSQLLDGQSSQKRLEILLEELSSISLEQKEFFTGLGRSSDVPIYLHYEGQLRNLRLKKNDVLRIIKDIWKGKASEDEKLDASSDLKEFLHKYLERQHGDQAGEWAYSLLDAIKRYLKDDFIGLFYDILTGKVDESLYHGQTLLLSHLLKVFIQTDSAETGLLTLSEFSEALRMAFPLKGEQDIEELVVAAQSNQETSKGSIAYQRLYTEDSEGGNSEFLALVKRQGMAERHQYINQLKVQLRDRREVSVEDLRTAFKIIDPTLDSATLDWNLSIVFQTKELRLHTALLDTEVALQRLSVANVSRAGPMPQLE